MDDILQNQNIVPAQFDIQHHDNPSSRNQTLRDLVRILLVQYGVDGDGWVRVYITQTNLSWIDPER